MDSGSAAPTLRRGMSEADAEKLLIVANGRPGGACDKALFAASGFCTTDGVVVWALIEVCNAFFLARDRAGSSIAARIATIRITTVSSIRVKARSGKRMICREVLI